MCERQLQVDLFDLIHLNVLLIPQTGLAWGQAYVRATATSMVF